MSDTTDALGRALHYAGQNIDRTTLGVAIRRLEASGYRIVPITTPQFHVQPAPTDDSVTREVSVAQQGSPKEGSGRV